MGFYLELNKSGPGGFYREGKVPAVYWVLYAIAGFALICMGAAAHSLLWDLAAAGSTLDIVLISLIVAAVPLYLLVGMKMAFFRKFIDLRKPVLEYGFEVLGKRPLRRTVAKSEIESVFLNNQRPSPNLAAKHHDDPQYQVRGHWKAGVLTKKKKEIVLDRHVDADALEPLAKDLKSWIA